MFSQEDKVEVNNCLLKLSYLSVAAAQIFLALQGFYLPNCFAVKNEKRIPRCVRLQTPLKTRQRTNFKSLPFINLIIIFLGEMMWEMSHCWILPAELKRTCICPVRLAVTAQLSRAHVTKDETDLLPGVLLAGGAVERVVEDVGGKARPHGGGARCLSLLGVGGAHHSPPLLHSIFFI